MSHRSAGITAASDEVSIAVIEKIDSGNFKLVDTAVLKMQISIDRPEAYNIIFRQTHDYLIGQKANEIAIKGSAVSKGVTLAHLYGAELKGVIQTAAASTNIKTRVVTKSSISKNFGERKMDAYLQDNNYWTQIGLGTLKKGMREAAFIAVATQN